MRNGPLPRSAARVAVASHGPSLAPSLGNARSLPRSDWYDGVRRDKPRQLPRGTVEESR